MSAHNPTVKRKLVTILSADVAEYSRLMAENEERTTRTFQAHKSLFESLVPMHEGRIFNTAGDAILAEFGSVVEAVRCATELQAALRTRNNPLPANQRVLFRMGINLGDVIIQGTDLLGDGVNVAARLQAAAEPGGICISGSVFDQIQNKLTLNVLPMGETSFKNIPQPVRTFAIRDAGGGIVLPAPNAGAPSQRKDTRLRRRLLLGAAIFFAVLFVFVLGRRSAIRKMQASPPPMETAAPKPEPVPLARQESPAPAPEAPSRESGPPVSPERLEAAMQAFARKYGVPRKVRESMEELQKLAESGDPAAPQKLAAHFELLKEAAAEMDAAGISVESVRPRIEETRRKLEAKMRADGKPPAKVPPLVERLKERLNEGDLREADELRRQIEAEL